MTCKKCGTIALDDSDFCERCGCRIGGSAGADDPISRPVIVVDTAAIRGHWRGLSWGEKLTVAGSALVVLSFFFPWISVTNPFFGSSLFGGAFSGPSSANASGFDFGRIWGGFYLVPVAAILCLGLTYYAINSRTNISVSRANALILVVSSIFGPQMLLGPLFVPLAQQVFAFGWFLTAAGFCIVGLGSFSTLVSLSRTSARLVAQ